MGRRARTAAATYDRGQTMRELAAVVEEAAAGGPELAGR